MANMLAWLTGREDRTQDPWPFQPQAELRTHDLAPSERFANMISGALGAGPGASLARQRFAEGVPSVLSLFPPLGAGLSAADLLHAKAAGDPMGVAAAAIGMLPGARPAGQAMKKATGATTEDLIVQIAAALEGKPEFKQLVKESPTKDAFIASLDKDTAAGKNWLSEYGTGAAPKGYALASIKNKTAPLFKPKIDPTEHALGAIGAVLDNKAAFSVYDKANGLHHVFDAKTGQLAGSSKSKSWADDFEKQWGTLDPKMQQFHMQDAAKNPTLQSAQTAAPAKKPSAESAYLEHNKWEDTWNVYDKEHKFINMFPSQEKAEGFKKAWDAKANAPAAVAPKGYALNPATGKYDVLDPATGKVTVSYYGEDWAKGAVEAQQKKAAAAPKQVLDYQKDDNGLYHIFDAISGKTQKVVDSELQAKNWITSQTTGFTKENPMKLGGGPQSIPINQISTPSPKETKAPDLLEAQKRYEEAIAPLFQNLPPRAVEQGYTTPAFRGLKIREGDVAPVHNFDKAEHQYATANPMLADMYADYLSKHPGWQVPSEAFDKGASVAPLLLDTSKYHYYDAAGAHWSTSAGNQRGIAQAREKGAPGVIVDNVWDEPNSTHALGTPSKIFITFPSGASTVKSRFAERFDPTSPDMLKNFAGLAAGGTGLAALLGSDRAEAAAPQRAQAVPSQPLSDRINQIIDSLDWQDQWMGRMRLPLKRKAEQMLGETVWPR